MRRRFRPSLGQTLSENKGDSDNAEALNETSTPNPPTRRARIKPKVGIIANSRPSFPIQRPTPAKPSNEAKTTDSVSSTLYTPQHAVGKTSCLNKDSMRKDNASPSIVQRNLNLQSSRFQRFRSSSLRGVNISESQRNGTQSQHKLAAKSIDSSKDATENSQERDHDNLPEKRLSDKGNALEKSQRSENRLLNNVNTEGDHQTQSECTLEQEAASTRSRNATESTEDRICTSAPREDLNLLDEQKCDTGNRGGQAARNLNSHSGGFQRFQRQSLGLVNNSQIQNSTQTHCELASNSDGFSKDNTETGQQENVNLPEKQFSDTSGVSANGQRSPGKSLSDVNTGEESSHSQSTLEQELESVINENVAESTKGRSTGVSLQSLNSQDEHLGRVGNRRIVTQQVQNSSVRGARFQRFRRPALRGLNSLESQKKRAETQVESTSINTDSSKDSIENNQHKKANLQQEQLSGTGDVFVHAQRSPDKLLSDVNTEGDEPTQSRSSLEQESESMSTESVAESIEGHSAGTSLENVNLQNEIQNQPTLEQEEKLGGVENVTETTEAVLRTNFPQEDLSSHDEHLCDESDTVTQREQNQPTLEPETTSLSSENLHQKSLSLGNEEPEVQVDTGSDKSQNVKHQLSVQEQGDIITCNTDTMSERDLNLHVGRQSSTYNDGSQRLMESQPSELNIVSLTPDLLFQPEFNEPVDTSVNVAEENSISRAENNSHPNSTNAENLLTQESARRDGGVSVEEPSVIEELPQDLADAVAKVVAESNLSNVNLGVHQSQSVEDFLQNLLGNTISDSEGLTQTDGHSDIATVVFSGSQEYVSANSENSTLFASNDRTVTERNTDTFSCGTNLKTSTSSSERGASGLVTKRRRKTRNRSKSTTVDINEIPIASNVEVAVNVASSEASIIDHPVLELPEDLLRDDAILANAQEKHTAEGVKQNFGQRSSGKFKLVVSRQGSGNTKNGWTPSEPACEQMEASGELAESGGRKREELVKKKKVGPNILQVKRKNYRRSKQAQTAMQEDNARGSTETFSNLEVREEDSTPTVTALSQRILAENDRGIRKNNRRSQRPHMVVQEDNTRGSTETFSNLEVREEDGTIVTASSESVLAENDREIRKNNRRSQRPHVVVQEDNTRGSTETLSNFEVWEEDSTTNVTAFSGSILAENDRGGRKNNRRSKQAQMVVQEDNTRGSAETFSKLEVREEDSTPTVIPCSESILAENDRGIRQKNRQSQRPHMIVQDDNARDSTETFSNLGVREEHSTTVVSASSESIVADNDRGIETVTSSSISSSQQDENQASISGTSASTSVVEAEDGDSVVGVFDTMKNENDISTLYSNCEDDILDNTTTAAGSLNTENSHASKNQESTDVIVELPNAVEDEMESSIPISTENLDADDSATVTVVSTSFDNLQDISMSVPDNVMESIIQELGEPLSSAAECPTCPEIITSITTSCGEILDTSLDPGETPVSNDHSHQPLGDIVVTTTVTGSSECQAGTNPTDSQKKKPVTRKKGFGRRRRIGKVVDGDTVESEGTRGNEAHTNREPRGEDLDERSRTVDKESSQDGCLVDADGLKETEGVRERSTSRDTGGQGVASQDAGGKVSGAKRRRGKAANPKVPAKRGRPRKTANKEPEHGTAETGEGTVSTSCDPGDANAVNAEAGSEQASESGQIPQKDPSNTSSGKKRKSSVTKTKVLAKRGRPRKKTASKETDQDPEQTGEETVNVNGETSSQDEESTSQQTEQRGQTSPDETSKTSRARKGQNKTTKPKSPAKRGRKKATDKGKETEQVTEEIAEGIVNGSHAEEGESSAAPGQEEGKQTPSRKRKRRATSSKKSGDSSSKDAPSGEESGARKKKRKQQSRPKKPDVINIASMRMADMVHYNPKNNPMKKPINEGAQPIFTNAPRRQTEQSEVILPSEGEGEEPSGENGAQRSTVLAPQVRIDADGNIVLDEDSLLIQSSVVHEDVEDREVVFENANQQYKAFSKKRQMDRWTREETLFFYEILSQTGTDFSLMAKLFPKRNRSELKRKFKREEKVNRDLIEKALNQRNPIPASLFAECLEETEEEMERALVVSAPENVAQA